MRKIIIIIALIPIFSFGQQSSINSHFYENLTMINPSVVGHNQNATIAVNARQQWYKFTDANIGRSSFNINKGFNNDGLGLEVFSDNSGNIIKSGFKLNYSRRVILNDDSYLFYGLSGGYQNNQINNISTLDFNFYDNKFNWARTASFGVSYTKKSFLMGASIDGLLETDLGFTNEQNTLEKNYYAFMLYNHVINENIELKPSALYKQSESGSSQFDLNLNLSYKNTIHFGLGYIGNFVENTNFGPLATIGISFNNIKSLISQEFTTSEVASYSVGTTELTIKYEIKEAIKKKPIVKEQKNEVIRIDTDKDGVFDDQDDCPNVFGSITANGCPDIDKDGIPDSQDMCPNTIGELINNGCPILSPQDSLILERAMTNLEFDKNSAKIKLESSNYISNIGKLLLGNKNMLLIISGHTDSDASEEYNYSLSAKRAKSVRDYLMKMGIKQSRLIIDFYGEKMPLLPNISESNMQKNRRVEFTVTFI